jgi:hypothetical protein
VHVQLYKRLDFLTISERNPSIFLEKVAQNFLKILQPNLYQRSIPFSGFSLGRCVAKFIVVSILATCCAVSVLPSCGFESK